MLLPQGSVKLEPFIKTAYKDTSLDVASDQSFTEILSAQTSESLKQATSTPDVKLSEDDAIDVNDCLIMTPYIPLATLPELSPEDLYLPVQTEMNGRLNDEPITPLNTNTAVETVDQKLDVNQALELNELNQNNVLSTPSQQQETVRVSSSSETDNQNSVLSPVIVQTAPPVLPPSLNSNEAQIINEEESTTRAIQPTLTQFPSASTITTPFNSANASASKEQLHETDGAAQVNYEDSDDFGDVFQSSDTVSNKTPEINAQPISETKTNSTGSTLKQPDTMNIETQDDNTKNNIHQYELNIAASYSTSKTQRANLSLTNESLGAINATIETDKASSAITFITENQEAKNALNHNMPHLKELFNQANITLSNTEVKHNANQGESQNHSNQSFSNKHMDNNDTQQELIDFNVKSKHKVSLIDTYV